MPNKKTNNKQKTHKLIKPRKPKIYSLKEAHSKSCLGQRNKIFRYHFEIMVNFIFYIYTHIYLKVFIIIIILFFSHNIFQ